MIEGMDGQDPQNVHSPWKIQAPMNGPLWQTLEGGFRQRWAERRKLKKQEERADQEEIAHEAERRLCVAEGIAKEADDLWQRHFNTWLGSERHTAAEPTLAHAREIIRGKWAVPGLLLSLHGVEVTASPVDKEERYHLTSAFRASALILPQLEYNRSTGKWSHRKWWDALVHVVKAQPMYNDLTLDKLKESDPPSGFVFSELVTTRFFSILDIRENPAGTGDMNKLYENFHRLVYLPITQLNSAYKYDGALTELRDQMETAMSDLVRTSPSYAKKGAPLLYPSQFDPGLVEKTIARIAGRNGRRGSA